MKRKGGVYFALGVVCDCDCRLGVANAVGALAVPALPFACQGTSQVGARGNRQVKGEIDGRCDRLALYRCGLPHHQGGNFGGRYDLCEVPAVPCTGRIPFAGASRGALPRSRIDKTAGQSGLQRASGLSRLSGSPGWMQGGWARGRSGKMSCVSMRLS